MKKFATMFVLVAFVGAVAGLAMAEGDAPKEQPKPRTVKATFVKADDTTITVKVKTEKEGDKERTFKFDDKTAVTVDGTEGKAVKDLKADMVVEVTLAGKDKPVTKIVAKTPEAPKTDK